MEKRGIIGGNKEKIEGMVFITEKYPLPDEYPNFHKIPAFSCRSTRGSIPWRSR